MLISSFDKTSHTCKIVRIVLVDISALAMHSVISYGIMFPCQDRKQKYQNVCVIILRFAHVLKCFFMQWLNVN